SPHVPHWRLGVIHVSVVCHSCVIHVSLTCTPTPPNPRPPHHLRANPSQPSFFPVLGPFPFFGAWPVMSSVESSFSFWSFFSSPLMQADLCTFVHLPTAPLPQACRREIRNCEQPPASPPAAATSCSPARAAHPPASSSAHTPPPLHPAAAPMSPSRTRNPPSCSR